jgi:hypothetical protein
MPLELNAGREMQQQGGGMQYVCTHRFAHVAQARMGMLHTPHQQTSANCILSGEIDYFQKTKPSNITQCMAEAIQAQRIYPKSNANFMICQHHVCHTSQPRASCHAKIPADGSLSCTLHTRHAPEILHGLT